MDNLPGFRGRVAGIRWWGVFRNIPFNGRLCEPASAPEFQIAFHPDGFMPTTPYHVERVKPAYFPYSTFANIGRRYTFQVWFDEPIEVNEESWLSITAIDPGRTESPKCVFNWYSSNRGDGYSLNVGTTITPHIYDMAFCLLPPPADACTGEGEAGACLTSQLAAYLLSGFVRLDADSDAGLTKEELETGGQGLSTEDFALWDTNADGKLLARELAAQSSYYPFHTADVDASGSLSLGELLRIIQFFNLRGFRCAETEGDTEDGYAGYASEGGEGQNECIHHSSDYQSPGGQIDLSELLRAVQIFSFGEYHYCPGNLLFEDDFCS